MAEKGGRLPGACASTGWKELDGGGALKGGCEGDDVGGIGCWPKVAAPFFGGGAFDIERPFEEGPLGGEGSWKAWAP